MHIQRTARIVSQAFAICLCIQAPARAAEAANAVPPTVVKPVRQEPLTAHEQRIANCRNMLSEKANLLSRIQANATSNLQQSVDRQKADVGFFGKLLGQDTMIDRAAQNPMLQANLGRTANAAYFSELDKMAQQCVGLGLATELLPIADELMAADVKPQVPGMRNVSSSTHRHSAALVYADAKKTEQAVSIYQATLSDSSTLQMAAMNPKPVLEALRQLAGLYLAQGQGKEAVALYDDFLQSNARLVTASQLMQLSIYMDAAAVYSKVGLHAKALTSLEKTKSLMDGASAGQMGGNGQDFLAAMGALSGAFQGASEMARVLNMGNPLVQTSDMRSNLALEAATTDKVYLMLGYEYAALGKNSELKRLYEVDYERFIQTSGGNYSGAPTAGKGAEGVTGIMPVRGALNFARMFAQLGMHQEASSAYREAVRLGQRVLLQRWLHFAVAEQSNRYNLQLYKAVFVEYLSWVSQFGASVASANEVAQAYAQLLQFKGSLADFDSALALAVRNRNDSELSATLTEIASISERLDSVDKVKLFTPNNHAAVAAYVEDMNKRAALLSKLQTAVGDAVEKSFVSKRTGDVYRQILQVLPADAAFVDIVKLSDQKTSGQEAPGQYIAFVAKPGQAQPILVKLGDAKAIEALVTAYQTTVRAALDAGELPDEQTLNAIGRKLHQQIITPLAAHIAGAGRLVISPDAALQLIPFEVLVSAEGRFLLQDVAVSYVTSGIDLLRPKLAREQIKTALVVAAPQYSATVEDSAKSRKTDALIPTRKKARLAFTPLDDTQEEATAVAAILASKQVTATTLLAKDASKSAILGRDAPHLLHIATHGFFLNDQGQASPLISEKAGSGFEVQLIKQGSSPMNRAGLALAGANTNQREGILYAAEIAGLDLRKINMAVLSACDTGVGDLESGDGVYGLRRAFMTAGASNVVTSLWPVASEETTEFMKAFYTALFSSSSNPDALRVSKIQLMKKYPNPYLWGAFVLAGN